MTTTPNVESSTEKKEWVEPTVENIEIESGPMGPWPVEDTMYKTS